MDRTDELLSTIHVFLPAPASGGVPSPTCIPTLQPPGLTLGCKRVLADIKINDEILNKINKLSSCREYSNDPSADISNNSEAFQRQVLVIQNALGRLKAQISAVVTNASQSRHHQLHFEIILETLQKQVAVQASTFQDMMKRHFEHVQQRQKRVVKYGQAESSSSVSKAPGSGGTKNYAMFSGNKLVAPPTSAALGSSSGGSSELRRRMPAAISKPNSGDKKQASAYDHHVNRSPYEDVEHLNATPYQISAQEIRKNAAMRTQQAESIEAIVSKMGGLFSQMATLIVEQGETVTRIEDDVEIGHQETTEAQESMQYFYDITKGNRSMIFKIFGLLVFFIFLFLVWLK